MPPPGSPPRRRQGQGRGRGRGTAADVAGAQRLSGYAAWDLGYAELHFCDEPWGDFEGEDLPSALDNCAARQRRFDHQRGGRP
ncbi:undecaprenyl diphosphate synthase family protein [Streptomyces sp. NPDC056716]|uniref:undecaprenyl diphosphate synthase family protein n=1 Tax=unclassified Streptomyces TaxID=2593676 RepID=UPI00367E8F51